MNFLEAAEKNKTARVRMAGETEWREIDQLNKPTTGWGIAAIKAIWEAEPEVYTFECEWAEGELKDETHVKPAFPEAKTKRDSQFLDSIIGKRTKVTIEVLP